MILWSLERINTAWKHQHVQECSLSLIQTVWSRGWFHQQCWCTHPVGFSCVFASPICSFRSNENPLYSGFVRCKKEKILSAFNILQSQLHLGEEPVWKCCISAEGAVASEQDRSVTQGSVTVEAAAVELMKLLAALSLSLRTLLVFLANLISVFRCFLIMEI